MNPAIGEMTCPICSAAGHADHKATLHRESNGKAKAFYLRCDWCGTLQPRKSGGQSNMKKMMDAKIIHLYQPGPEQDKAVEAVVEKAKEKATETIRENRREASQPKPEKQQSKKTLFSFLSEGADDE